MMFPSEFEARMKNMLGTEYDDFFRAVSEDAAVKAAFLSPRVSEKEFFEGFSKIREKIPFCDNGYIIDCDLPGKNPMHHAGAFYVQDPSAMATVHAAPVKSGAKILDVCAAPGGKSVQLSFKAGDGGLLISNEVDKKRVRALLSNVERMGLKNTIVTSLETDKLGKMYRGYFDVVLVDAPCSGEGMFRKYDVALGDWSEKKVASCAALQRKILSDVCETVANDGLLIYSTCTFSEEENENCVKDFLSSHPDFSPVEVNRALLPYTHDGNGGMSFCRRFYPHIYPGEGQFFCVMRRKTEQAPEILYKSAYKKPSADEERLAREFLRENTTADFDIIHSSADGLRVLSSEHPVPKGAFSYGVNIGKVERGRFIAHHQLFSAYGAFFKRKIILSPESKEAALYISGQGFACDTENGYCAVFIGSVPIGGGKVSGGMLKNHYPKGLRMA